jgi:ferredoxin
MDQLARYDPGLEIMKIVVDRSLCDGNALCSKEAPDIFAVDAQDTLHVLKTNFEEKDLQRVRRAVEVCPKCALSIAE